MMKNARVWSCLLLLSLLIALCGAPRAAAATIELTSPGDGYSTQSKSVTFNYIYHMGDDNISKPYCAILVNDTNLNATHIAAGTTGQFTVDGLRRPASYHWQIACEETVSEVRKFNILSLDPPTLGLASPRDQSSAVGPIVNFYFDYTAGSDEIPATNCTLIVGPFVQGKALVASGTRGTIASEELHPATYSWFVRCDRTDGNDPLETKPWLITVTAPPVVANVTNTTAPANNTTAVSNTFANEQVTIDAPANAPVGKPVRLVVRSLDGKVVVGAVVDVYLAEGGKIALAPTDAYGQTAFTPNALGDESYTVENLLLVKRADTRVTQTGAPDNSGSGANSGTGTTTPGSAGSGSANGSNSGAAPGTASNNNAGAAGNGASGSAANPPGGANSGANSPSSGQPSSAAGIPLWLMVAGAGLAIIIVGAGVYAFRKPKSGM